MNKEVKPIIGTLSEKSTHSYLKTYLDSNKNHHEIPLLGYVCDIFDGKKIYEIQTRGFSKIKDKIKTLIATYDVTVVYPLYKKRKITWINKKTNEIVEVKKSFISTSFYNVFYELYNLKELISNPNFHLKVVMLEGMEYRYLDGYGLNKKNKATKIDKIPENILSTYDLFSKEDYYNLVPFTKEEVFTIKEFEKRIKASHQNTYALLSILIELNIVTKTGKLGKAYTYQLTNKDIEG